MQRVVLLVRIFSRLASRLSLDIEPSSNGVSLSVSVALHTAHRRECHRKFNQSIHTSNMLDTMCIQKQFDYIQHGCKLRENDCLFRILRAFINRLQDVQDFVDLGRLGRKV